MVFLFACQYDLMVYRAVNTTGFYYFTEYFTWLEWVQSNSRGNSKYKI